MAKRGRPKKEVDVQSIEEEIKKTDQELQQLLDVPTEAPVLAQQPPPAPVQTVDPSKAEIESLIQKNISSQDAQALQSKISQVNKQTHELQKKVGYDPQVNDLPAVPMLLSKRLSTKELQKVLGISEMIIKVIKGGEAASKKNFGIDLNTALKNAVKTLNTIVNE